MPTPVRPSRPSAPRTSWVVVLCSFVAGAATSLAVVRLSVGSASSEKNAAVTVAVTPEPAPESFPRPTITRDDPPPQIYDSPAPVVDAPSGPPPDPAKMLPQPAAVATASLGLANSLLQVTDFVNTSGTPGGHIGLYNDLVMLKLASEAMLSDNGSDPATTARLNETLSTQLYETINRADTIAKRASETDDARQTSAGLRDTLKQLSGK